MTQICKAGRRYLLAAVWTVTGFAAIGSAAYPPAMVWLEQNTLVVQVVNSDDQPIANARVTCVKLEGPMR
jgi:hypothetical protein